ncbi:SDR family NAD(P)-dependent oxidoreductase [Nocardia thailandica]
MTHNGFRFEGKTALITGGSSGMGLATARRLIDEGARVVVTGRDRTRLDASVASLGAAAHGVAGDGGDLADVDALIAEVRARFGHLDVLFANAGIGSFQPVAEVTEDLFARVVDSNLKAAFFTIQRALPILREHGAIVAAGRGGPLTPATPLPHRRVPRGVPCGAAGSA